MGTIHLVNIKSTEQRLDERRYTQNPLASDVTIGFKAQATSPPYYYLDVHAYTDEIESSTWKQPTRPSAPRRRCRSSLSLSDALRIAYATACYPELGNSAQPRGAGGSRGTRLVHPMSVKGGGSVRRTLSGVTNERYLQHRTTRGPCVLDEPHPFRRPHTRPLGMRNTFAIGDETFHPPSVRLIQETVFKE
ncbi:hypothetical protein LZ32DRAFT_157855 [Colletotrichum eremochloae]|nr:hypothetical protein LZ32DRAFT_157855 [Colletotrichum eremochloae]